MIHDDDDGPLRFNWSARLVGRSLKDNSRIEENSIRMQLYAAFSLHLPTQPVLQYPASSIQYITVRSTCVGVTEKVPDLILTTGELIDMFLSQCKPQAPCIGKQLKPPDPDVV
ncbi:hypothetical protein EVAR_63853_1 [Eumeta japonica]|uniref:Uncharacterized protein n=1 Tax=Eumeta variegata TaxID=151549 RepID=A0A4C1YZZ4_EUMVA|nr:hypothetical protein EVAR_63853_1 [Eumeta japonica]